MTTAIAAMLIAVVAAGLPRLKLRNDCSANHLRFIPQTYPSAIGAPAGEIDPICPAFFADPLSKSRELKRHYISGGA